MYAPQGPVYATEFAPPVVFQAEAAQAPVLATGFAPPVVSEGQAPGTKRAATDFEGPHAKRAKTGPTAISDDPLFVSFLLISYGRVLKPWDRNPCQMNMDIQMESSSAPRMGWF
jgi:hypothetical protein